MMKIRIVIEVIAKYTICIALLFLAGCSGKAQRIFRDTSYKINYIDYTNYKIGEEKTAPIGDPIIEMKKHRQKTQLNAAVSSDTRYENYKNNVRCACRAV